MLKNKILAVYRQVLCLFMLVLPICTFAAAPQSQLTIHMTGFQNNVGVARIALYNSANTYEDRQHAAEAAFQKAAAPIVNQQASYTFTNLPYGNYAIKVFHDKDMNGVLKKNFLGIPQEEVGFSNNPPLAKKMPTFEQTQFVVSKPKTELNITLGNF